MSSRSTGETTPGDGQRRPGQTRQPKPPSMLDAILPIVVLIVLIALTIASFGVGATDGPLQVALMLSAAFASLVALKNGFTSAALAEAAIGGVSTAVGAIFILLSVGALIGTWNMAGTIPTVVDYGVRLLNPSVFFLATAAICAIVGVVTGSSWTTAGTLGVAFVGMANVMGVSEAIAAGAVICGAYFGDKMTPLSETTILVPRLVGGVTTSEHIRNMFWTAGPALGVSLVLFLIIGLGVDSSGEISTDEALDALESVFHISLVSLLPLALLVVFTVRKAPPFLAIMGSALFAGILACFTQWSAVQAFVDDPDKGTIATAVHAVYGAMATGFVSNSGIEPIDELFSRGGMASLLTTVWLVLAAMGFAAIVEHAGFLERLLRPVVTRARSRGSLILAVNSSAIGLERHGRRSVRRRRAAGPDVPRRVRAQGPGTAGAQPGGGRLGNGDLAARALEHLRRLHVRRARRADGVVPALLLLQPPEPHPRRRLRISRLQGPDADHTRRRERTAGRRRRPRSETGSAGAATTNHRRMSRDGVNRSASRPCRRPRSPTVSNSRPSVASTVRTTQAPEGVAGGRAVSLAAFGVLNALATVAGRPASS